MTIRRVLSLALVLVPWGLAGCENDVRPVGLVELPDGGDAETGAPPPEAGAPDAGGDGDAATSPYPALLSGTGLFTSVSPETLAPGVEPYQPKFALWSDGATKRRWISLPAGAQIDTTDMDFWTYPVGTRVWKEFSLGGTRIETRMLYKSGPAKADWVMIAYQWRPDQKDAVAVPDGVQNASGTQHDIPDQFTCRNCHGNMQDTLLGVTAIQLSHALPGLTLSGLASSGRLTVNPPSAGFTIPGGAVAEAALGYLHANCGLCHNSKSVLASTHPMFWWESTKTLGTLQETTGYTTGVGQPTILGLPAIDPGSPSTSAIVIRMSSRTPGTEMPPIGTEVVDSTGVAAVTAFIQSLPRPADAGAGDSGVMDAAGGATDGG